MLILFIIHFIIWFFITVLGRLFCNNIKLHFVTVTHYTNLLAVAILRGGVQNGPEFWLALRLPHHHHHHHIYKLQKFMNVIRLWFWKDLFFSTFLQRFLFHFAFFKITFTPAKIKQNKNAYRDQFEKKKDKHIKK